MKNYEFRDRLEASMPDVPPIFHNAVEAALASIAQSELENKEAHSMKPIINKRRTMTFVLAAILMIAAIATAATLLSRNVFDVTMGDTPVNATMLTQHDLAKETIGDAEITIKEAAYDGMSLYILYSIRDMTATEQFGAMDDESGQRFLRQEDYERMEQLGVGWWLDNLWINGKKVSMPNMSGGEDLPGEENGEILYYVQYRLDQENLFLDGKNVEIAMPIGERQDFGSLTRDPEGGYAKPEKGIITFIMDCSMRGQVVTTEPNITMTGPKWNAKASKVVYSPIQMYVTLNWEIQPEVLAAYIEENGDGYYENGVKFWDYDGLEVCGSEIMNLQLVDKDGKPIFENMQGFYGCGGASVSEAWYTFPYMEKYPDTMFLAPEIGGELDMTQAIQVK